MTTRLEAIDPQHPDLVALMYGPLVLFPVTTAPPAVTRQQVLNAKRSGAKAWQVESSPSPMRLLPFTEISDEPYTTYLQISRVT
jgi:hypothetical protein